MMKRILSLLLAFLMVVSILPTPTHAEDTAGGPTAAVTEPACPTCGKSGCTSSHENWCRICLADNCGVDHSKKPAETQASADEAGAINEDEAPHPMVGKIVMLAGTVSYPEVIENPNISVYGSMVGVSAFPERMEIESVVTIGNVDYYQLKAAAGYTWPEYPVSINEYKCYEHHWLKSSQVALAEESEPECPVCGEPGCTAQHKQCEICGKYDCTKLHFRCDRCGKYDCGKSHLICPACGNVDCTKNHVFCGYCGTYDDCEGHDFAPAVEAELPENPVLTEGADVSIVDENGQPATSFRLTEGSKSSISAWSTLDDSSEAAYQWQICYDDENDLWTNIQGQTGKGLLASAAMFLPILEQKGAAAVRCVMTVDGETRTSDPIPVTIAGEQIEMATFARYASAAPAAYAAAPAAEDNENKVNLIINYVFTDGKIAANPRTATLPAGVAYAPATSVTVPDIPGYVPQLGESATDGNAALNGYALTLHFTAEEMQSDRTVKIVYHPAPVKVVVHHYQQNVDNDNYTLKESEEITLTTGETVGDVHKTYEGFYNLLYEHPVVAADGSTVVDVYYDRYYYLMTFDLSGGYGIDAVYARYGTPIPENPGNAVRPGYTLTHWTLDGYTQPVYKTMPARNTTFVAVWAAQDTAKLTVMYWGENPNDDEYSIINTKELKVEPGSTLQYIPSCRISSSHVHNAACYGINSGSASVGAHDIDMYKRMDLESGYVYVTWKAQKWAYLYLNGQWYHATAEMYDFDNWTDKIDNYSALNGETLNARKCKANLTLRCDQHMHGDGCCTCSTPYHRAEETCGLFISLEDRIWTFDHSDSVTVLPDGSSVLNVYFSRKEYTLRFYYAASVNEYSSNTKEDITYRVVGGTTYYFGSWGNSTTDEVPLLDRYFVEGRDKHDQTGEVQNKPTLKRTDHGYTEGTTSGANGYTYYYISFTAKYGANIYDMWPADVFNSVYCYDHDWYMNEDAFVSAWNGEHHVYYSQKNKNETIKGKYAVLDDNLLWYYNLFGAYAEVETDANGNEYNVIDFLCFWENGANVGWSYPRLFRYHIYVEPYEGMDTTGLQSRTWKGKTYYFKEAYDTIDDSDVKSQTYPEIEGFTQLTDYFVSGSDGKAKDGTYESNVMESYDKNLYVGAYDVYFYYNRTKYQLQFFNETGVEKTEQVKFECPLAAFASYTPSAPVDENGIPIYEAGSHRFAGWYDNPNFEGDPFDFDNTAMPAENIILYAKWTPVHRTVRFFLDKASMDEGKTLPEKMAELYAAKHNGASDPNDPYAAKYATLTAVPHGSKITIPETPGASKGYEDVHPYEGYGFIGWLYLNDEGEETAFDPANMPVTRNLDLYAKWSSNVLCPYEIRYILDANGNGKLDADETTAVANPTTGSTLA
ncbi:MAG: InlB B-repeat-containing protein, partial [Oscillospiraceae bacterium]|nr:InlB B-repeat-containing protein [Oscillospiraceae bacterium]